MWRYRGGPAVSVPTPGLAGPLNRDNNAHAHDVKNVPEYGGIWWQPEIADDASGTDAGQSWGYGQRPQTEDDWHKRFQGLTDTLLDNPLMFGYCYTQLTDVFQEHNGIYRFDRSAKLDISIEYARYSNDQRRSKARTATTISSAGNRNPANADFGDSQGRPRVDGFTG
jgi:hypothetical protein